MAIEKIKILKPFGSYQLNSTANLANFEVNGAGLAVLFSWQLQNGPHNFDFFSIAMGADYYFSLFLLSIECPNFSCIINQS